MADKTQPDFLTPIQLCERFPFLKLGGVRNWIWRDINGFRARCVRMVGHKVLVSVPDVLAWIDEQKAGPTAGSKSDGPRAA